MYPLELKILLAINVVLFIVMISIENICVDCGMLFDFRGKCFIQNLTVVTELLILCLLGH